MKLMDEWNYCMNGIIREINKLNNRDTVDGCEILYHLGWIIHGDWWWMVIITKKYVSMVIKWTSNGSINYVWWWFMMINGDY